MLNSATRVVTGTKFDRGLHDELHWLDVPDLFWRRAVSAVALLNSAANSTGIMVVNRSRQKLHQSNVVQSVTYRIFVHAGAREGIITGKSGGIISRFVSNCC